MKKSKKTKTDSLKRGVIYIRVSSDDQEDNFSLKAQEKTVKEWMISLGYRCIKIYQDIETATSMDKRDGFLEMLKDAKNGVTEGIFTFYTDRAFRNLKDMLNVIDDLKDDYNVLFFFYDMRGVDIYTSTGRGFLQQRGMFSEMFISQHRDKVKLGLKAKEERGHWIGQAPYGYEKIEITKKVHYLKPLKEEQDVIDKMKKMKSDGFSYNRISKVLNESKVPTRMKKPRKRGKRKGEMSVWHLATVKNVLERKIDEKYIVEV